MWSLKPTQPRSLSTELFIVKNKARGRELSVKTEQLEALRWHVENAAATKAAELSRINGIEKLFAQEQERVKDLLAQVKMQTQQQGEASCSLSLDEVRGLERLRQRQGDEIDGLLMLCKAQRRAEEALKVAYENKNTASTNLRESINSFLDRYPQDLPPAERQQLAATADQGPSVRRPAVQSPSVAEKAPRKPTVASPPESSSASDDSYTSGPSKKRKIGTRSSTQAADL